MIVVQCFGLCQSIEANRRVPYITRQSACGLLNEKLRNVQSCICVRTDFYQNLLHSYRGAITYNCKCELNLEQNNLKQFNSSR